MTADAAEALPPASAPELDGPDAAAPLPPEPAGAPRPVTGRVRRRAWTEPHVRFWLLLTAALFVICASVAFREVSGWRREVWLIRHGRLVEAEVTSAGGLGSRWQRLPPDSVVTIQYDVDGKKYTQGGYLHGRKDYIQVRGMVPIRVDPADPDVWTARTEPTVLAQQLTGAAVVVPVLGVLVVVTLLRRAKALRTWRDGRPVPALVVESRQTAVAPKSRFVRCTPADRSDNRIVGVYVPQWAARELRPGDALWLVFPPGGRGRPVAASWFDEDESGAGSRDAGGAA